MPDILLSWTTPKKEISFLITVFSIVLVTRFEEYSVCTFLGAGCKSHPVIFNTSASSFNVPSNDSFAYELSENFSVK